MTAMTELFRKCGCDDGECFVDHPTFGRACETCGACGGSGYVLAKKETAQLRLLIAFQDRSPFCPDHRDKVAGKPCRECEIERLESIIDRAYQKLSCVVIEREAAPEIVRICDNKAMGILSEGLKKGRDHDS
jgi:hypothetical protein